MTMPKKPPRRTPAIEPPDEPVADSDMGPILARPDGYYWEAPDGKQEFGPFESVAQAMADRDSAADEASGPGETLQEAEDEIGISDWIDPETGQPADGQSPPHFEAE